ncbi:Asp23/Gls24 family envelope stress response protein [Corynebacterium bovis]|uniref:Asp23/Gls24 family envelope stress response protein n=1 Tax=Corynebacterium bovis TaxID=36808 RepID=UPI00313910CE
MSQSPPTTPPGAAGDTTTHPRAAAYAEQRRHTEIDEKILDRIARRAALSVPGVIEHASGLNRLTGRSLPRFDIRVAPAERAASVDAQIAVRWPSPVVAVAQATRETVAEWIEHTTGVPVVAVNVDVVTLVAADGSTSSASGTPGAGSAHGRRDQVTVDELLAAPRTPELHRIYADPLDVVSPETEERLIPRELQHPQPIDDVTLTPVSAGELPVVRHVTAPEPPVVRSVEAPRPVDVRHPEAPEPQPLTPVSVPPAPHVASVETPAPHPLTAVVTPRPVQPAAVPTPPEPELRRIPTPRGLPVQRLPRQPEPEVYVPRVPTGRELRPVGRADGLRLTRDIPTPEGLPVRTIPTPEGLPVDAVPTPQGLDVTIYPQSRRRDLDEVHVRPTPVIDVDVPAETHGTREVTVRPSRQRARLEYQLGLRADDPDADASHGDGSAADDTGADGAGTKGAGTGTDGTATATRSTAAHGHASPASTGSGSTTARERGDQ